jgi:4-deoxy-L-threo-5-hexosulose-uronate ketol-isomerase
MEIRYSIHPDHMKQFDTETIRKHLLIERLFEKGKINMVYSHVDRIIAGGACPAGKPLALSVTKELGVDYFLERREMGIINIGAAGSVAVDRKEYKLANKEVLYIGTGAKTVVFKSADGKKPAKFYFLSTPAHASFPTVKLSMKDAQKVEMGSADQANARTIYQFIHPAVMKSCQLVMGFTVLKTGSVWNTMPPHTHDRRMEVYLYFDLPADGLVFHLCGEPQETRHIVVRNEEAVISPSWSIHAGVGTVNYTFVWGMAGENQTFTDMDHCEPEQIK